MRKTTFRKHVSISCALAVLLSALAVPVVAQESLQAAKAVVAKYVGRQDHWDGPVAGPKAVAGKKIVYVAGDLKNGGILGAADGVKEAAKAIGWDVRVIDGQGSVSGRTAAFNQAITLKPDGIVLGGLDAVEQKPGIEAAAKAGIRVVGWHAGPKPGPIGTDVFANVTTDPMEVSKAAASWAIIDSDGRAGVVIFTDSAAQIAMAKANAMAEIIKKCSGCQVLSIEDMPIADTSNRMGQLTTTLLQRHGAKWTHALAINDLYFDFMGPALAAMGVKQDGRPTAVAAGDGSESAYQRVRTNSYQAVTVAEPLNLQGWQVVDELNQAFTGQKWSGYVTPLHVVTAQNIAYDGGADNRFDPENQYRDQYRRIWGKSK